MWDSSVQMFRKPSILGITLTAPVLDDYISELECPTRTPVIVLFQRSYLAY